LTEVPPDPASGATEQPPGFVPGPEEALLLEVGRGDAAAFEALYARFARPLMSFLTTLSADAAEAQDLVQETFVRAWQAAPRWQPRGRASTWLFTIARHAAANWRAKRRVRQAAEVHGASPAGGRARGLALVPAAAPADVPAALERAVRDLSEPLRTAFVLARLHGRTLAEIAEIEAVALGTVKSRLAAAESALRAALAPRLGDGRSRP
jgi:RNA polymerase sigma-70 factor (ECF subfamily)